MEVKTLYTLVTIADRGSFAEAGQALGLSVSAVSMQMRGLEEELGVVLFDRSRRPPELTGSGKILVQRARDLITHWESLSDSLRKEATGGILKVGAVHTSVSGILPLALQRLRQQVERMEIHVTTGLTHQLEMAVYHRQLDVAVVTEPETTRGELQFMPFVEESLVVIVHKSAPEKTDKELLERNPYVQFNREARVGRIIQNEITRRKLFVQPTMQIDTLDGVVAMVANGLGASVVPARGVLNEFPASIRTVPFGSPPLKRQLGLLFSHDHPRAHLSLALLEALRSLSEDAAQHVQAEEKPDSRIIPKRASTSGKRRPVLSRTNR